MAAVNKKLNFPMKFLRRFFLLKEGGVVIASLLRGVARRLRLMQNITCSLDKNSPVKTAKACTVSYSVWSKLSCSQLEINYNLFSNYLRDYHLKRVLWGFQIERECLTIPWGLLLWMFAVSFKGSRLPSYYLKLFAVEESTSTNI